MVFAFYTLGCKANQFDTQAMVKLCRQKGHTVVPFSEAADIYVVNTCTVTAESDRKSRQIIRGIRRRKPDAVVGICGCFSQVSPQEAQKLGADVICGTQDRENFLGKLASVKKPKAIVDIQPYTRGIAFEQLPAGGLEGRTRALLKVQDGCDNYCTYCIIPYSRGHVRSLPLAEAIGEARSLADSGYREIVLTGIEISSYGADLEGSTDLSDLVCGICNAVPEVRIHLGSLEPRTVTKEFCERIQDLPNLLPHFHLSLQSGCDATLARMRRKYSTARFYESVTLLRRYFPDAGITADMITGFPGETEEEFSESLNFIQKCNFSNMHIFPYSQRPGTPAADMPQLPRQLREERAKLAAEAAAQMRSRFLAAQEGKIHSVLFESAHGAVQQGHTANYLPVVVCNAENLQGKIREVQITGTCSERLTGEPVNM